MDPKYGLQKKTGGKNLNYRDDIFEECSRLHKEDQLRNTWIREELNIFNLTAKIIKPGRSVNITRSERKTDEFRRKF
jgi:hypothetical protein